MRLRDIQKLLGTSTIKTGVRYECKIPVRIRGKRIHLEGYFVWDGRDGELVIPITDTRPANWLPILEALRLHSPYVMENYQSHWGSHELVIKIPVKR